MIVNRKLSERSFVWVAMLLASCSAVAPAAFAQDSSRGWEGANPDINSEQKAVESKDKAPAKQPAAPAGDSSSAGWNESKKPSTEASVSSSAPAHSGDVVTAGDTALSAGQFAEALQKLDDAWRAVAASKPDSKTTALFFERKALALRGLQRLSEAERVLKQAIGHATTGGAPDPATQVRLLFALADIQSQEGLPRDGAVTANQALNALNLAGPGKGMGPHMAVEILNLQGRLLADSGDSKNAEAKLNEAVTKAEALPPSFETNLPPASPISKYSDLLKAKIKVNKFHLADTKGSGAAEKKELDNAIPIMKNYASGMAADTRYSPTTLQVDKGVSADSLNALLQDSNNYPGPDNLIKAYVLTEQARIKSDANEMKGAAEAARDAFAIRSKVLPSSSTFLAETLIQLSELQLKFGKASEAAGHASRASSVLERSAGRKSLPFARASLALSEVYLASNKPSQVESLLVETVGTLSNIRGNSDPETLHAMDLLGSAYIRNKKYAEAAQYGEIALRNSEKLYGSTNPKIVLALTNLGTACSHLKKFPEANKYLERAQSILARSGKTNTAEYADVLACTGVSYTLQKKWAPAASSLKQARSIYVTTYGATSPHATQMTQLLKTMESLKAGPRVPGFNILLENKFTPMRPMYR